MAKNVVKGKSIINGVRAEFEKMVEKLSNANAMLVKQEEENNNIISNLEKENNDIQLAVSDANKMIGNIKQNILS